MLPFACFGPDSTGEPPCADADRHVQRSSRRVQNRTGTFGSYSRNTLVQYERS